MPTTPKFDKFKKYFHRKKPSIQEIVREPTAGGIVFRHNKEGKVEILLIQDAKDRWTIPKGHIEEGETAQATAKREIGEEAGLNNVEVLNWLGKIHFRYRRVDKLVLMTTQIYLVRDQAAYNAKQAGESQLKGASLCANADSVVSSRTLEKVSVQVVPSDLIAVWSVGLIIIIASVLLASRPVIQLTPKELLMEVE